MRYSFTLSRLTAAFNTCVSDGGIKIVPCEGWRGTPCGVRKIGDEVGRQGCVSEMNDQGDFVNAPAAVNFEPFVLRGQFDAVTVDSVDDFG